jgi:L-serine deaminase
MAGDGIHSVSLDEAIEAMRRTSLRFAAAGILAFSRANLLVARTVTARDMHLHYKETSLSGLATTVRIPLSSPAC